MTDEKWLKTTCYTKNLCKQHLISNILQKKNLECHDSAGMRKKIRTGLSVAQREPIFMKKIAVVKTSYLERTKQLFNSTCKASFWPSSSMNPNVLNAEDKQGRMWQQTNCSAFKLPRMAFPPSQRARERQYCKPGITPGMAIFSHVRNLKEIIK